MRLEYTDLPQYEIGFGFRSRRGRGRGWWLQDWPDAEDHFSAGVERLTRIDVGDPRHASLPRYPRGYGAMFSAHIGQADEVRHILYDIQEKDRTFIPGSRHLRHGSGGTITVMQPRGTEPAWRALYDDKNRMIVAVNFNTDVGDAWEFADVPYYPAAMTLLAYRYGINYLAYAMTH